MRSSTTSMAASAGRMYCAEAAWPMQPMRKPAYSPAFLSPDPPALAMPNSVHSVRMNILTSKASSEMMAQVASGAAFSSPASVWKPMARMPSRSAREATRWRSITLSRPSASISSSAAFNPFISTYDCDGPWAALCAIRAGSGTPSPSQLSCCQRTPAWHLRQVTRSRHSE